MPTNFLACKANFLNAYKPINYTLCRLYGYLFITSCAYKATKFYFYFASLARYLYKCLQFF